MALDRSARTGRSLAGGEAKAAGAPKVERRHRRKASGRQGKGGAGLAIERFFTRAGSDPYAEVEWELRSATITNERVELIFEQRDCEIPKGWSQLATNVVVSKYFRGHLGTPERESSVKQLIGRVVGRIHEWGEQGGYFRSTDDGESFKAELTHLLVTQKMAFNSPVWFNLGVAGTKQQASACFINSVDDTMESIMGLAPIPATETTTVATSTKMTRGLRSSRSEE
jgi:ribonucleoside-diphosphate reductase alpha chain